MFPTSKRASWYSQLDVEFGHQATTGAFVPLLRTFSLFAFHPSRNHPAAKVRAFIDFCVEVIQQL
jgi:hypothetical protein